MGASAVIKQEYVKAQIDFPEENQLFSSGYKTLLKELSFFEFRSEIQIIMLLFLPIHDLLNVESLFKGVDFREIYYRLLYSKNQKQVSFRFTKDLNRVFNKRLLGDMGIRLKEAKGIITELERIKKGLSHYRTLLNDTGIACSSSKDALHGMDKMLDHKYHTYWLSNGSLNQQKVDWVLLDMGGVGVIEQVDIKPSNKAGARYGFQRAWLEFGFEVDDFHFRSKDMFGKVNDENKYSFTPEKHFSGLRLTARYVKLWLQGCFQMLDGKWCFALSKFTVCGLRPRHIPAPIARMLAMK